MSLVCIECGAEVEDNQWTRLSNDHGHKCEECRLAWSKKFERFLGSWSSKMTSEHGVELNATLLTETKARVRFLTKKVREKNG